MQIERFNHLQFPTDRRTGADDAARAAGQEVLTASVAPQPSVPPLAQAPGRSAVVRLGSTGDSPAVYSRAPRGEAAQHAQADWDGMAQRHQEALARQGQDTTTLGVDKDGILVAKSRTAFSTQESDFVALAVSAMRDFRDTAERAKAAQAAEGISAPPIASGGLRSGLAHLAARFKAFA